MDRQIRVLVVDDHAVVRKGLTSFLALQESIEVVGEAGDGTEAHEKAARLKPDVVLMDLQMPGVGGIESTALIRNSSPDTKVIVLTSFSDDNVLVAALRAGVAGYLTKDIDPVELVDAITTIHSGEFLLHPMEGSVGRDTLTGEMTIAFSDVESFTEMTERLGDEQAFRVIKSHNRIVRDQVRLFGGTELELKGDGFLLAFKDVDDALRCCIAIHRELEEFATISPESRVRVHMGVHTGLVIEEGDGQYFGRTVILAARIAAVASGGELLISEASRGACSATDFSITDRGTHHLKGIAQPQHLFQVG